MRGRHNCVEDTNYTRVPVRLRVQSCFWGLDHHIWVHIWLDGVTVPSHVVGCIIYSQGLATENLFASYNDTVPLFIRKRAVSVAFIFSI